jgi:(p)ppGpp synthase/HD superfamily hydrolase
MQPSMNKTGHYTLRFEEALVYTTRLHNTLFRKGTRIPYIAHLIAVTSLVIEWGGDEDMAIAALLHDAVEDQGGLKTLAEIRQRFGERVARIVEACSDSHETPKPPWRARKDAYLRRLQNEPKDAHIVSLADKLHNARSILFDLRHSGLAVLDRFNGGREGTLWYYRSLVEIFQRIDQLAGVEELKRVVSEIEQIARAD